MTGLKPKICQGSTAGNNWKLCTLRIASIQWVKRIKLGFLQSVTFEEQNIAKLKEILYYRPHFIL